LTQLLRFLYMEFTCAGGALSVQNHKIYLKRYCQLVCNSYHVFVQSCLYSLQCTVTLPKILRQRLSSILVSPPINRTDTQWTQEKRSTIATN
jgi:hypothetical protein